MLHFISYLPLIFQVMTQPDFISYNQEIPGISYAMEMVPVKGGTYFMGSDDPEHPDEAPVHEVRVDAFWMAAYEISWDQYEAFIYERKNPTTSVSDQQLTILGIDGLSGASSPYTDMSLGMGKDGFPATNMTQYAAIEFCKWLTSKTGIFYRLPTEAEWEYACRTGSSSDFYFEGIENIDDYAWYKKNSGVNYMEIGKLKPNDFGLYDMLGNVSEWTMDQYSSDFFSDLAEWHNPWLIPTELYPRTVRGGSWKDKADQCKCTSRKPSKPNWKRRDPQFPKSRWWHTNAAFIGIRIIRPYKVPSTEEIKKFWLEPMDDYN